MSDKDIKRLNRLRREVEGWRTNPPTRNKLICAAKACEGCKICEPEKFKFNKFGLFDK